MSNQSKKSYMELHVGKLVKKEVDNQGIRYDDFARRICTSRTNLYHIFEKPDLSTDKLVLISKALNKNLLDLIAKEVDGPIKEAAGEGEILDSVGGFHRKLQKNNPGVKIIGGYDTLRNREEMKDVLSEYFKKPHIKPLLIIEKGYTFCSVEVVRQVAQEMYGNKGWAVCPKSLSDLTALRAMPQQVLTDYIDMNTYGSLEGAESWLSEFCRVQQDIKKHFVCILHVDNQYEVEIARDTWEDLFHIVEYKWSRTSLLSWATDNKMHTKLIDYIEYHGVMKCVGTDYGVPDNYPTRHAYSQGDFEYVSDCLYNGMKLVPYIGSRPYRFAREVEAFDKDNCKKDSGYEPLPINRTVSIGFYVNGDYFEDDIVMSADDVAILVYLYNQAMNGPLKGVNDDDIDERFDLWLKNNHPNILKALIDATERILVERLDDGGRGYQEDSPYKSILCSPPENPYAEWTIDPGNKYEFCLNGLPERIV